MLLLHVSSFKLISIYMYIVTHILQKKNLHEHMYDHFNSYRKISDIYSVHVHCFLGNDNCTSDYTEIIEIHVHV